MADIHLVRPQELPESYKNEMEIIIGETPENQADKAQGLLERLVFETQGEEFFCMATTVLQYLNEQALARLKQKAREELDTRLEELPGELRHLYKILEPCTKTGKSNLIERLTPATIEKFIDRKPRQPGRIDLVVDLETGKYYLVPKDVEHKDFVPTIPHDKDSSMIPFYFILERDSGRYHVKEIVTGASSFEGELNVKHTYKDLELARKLAWELIAKSPIILAHQINRDEVLKDYATSRISNPDKSS